MTNSRKEGETRMGKKLWFALAASAVLAVGVAACGDDSSDSGGSSGSTPSGLSGDIRVDGSSTVGPLTEAIAEEFNSENSDVKVTVGTSGTGGGFEKFCAGETDISDASRPIEPDEEKACQAKGIGYDGIQVANDALTVAINPDNPVKCMTIDQLKSVWEPKSSINSWSQIQGLQPSFGEDLALYSPGTDSGTFDFFTDKINGEEGAERTAGVNDIGEDDNATVTGVQGAKGGMGYFGYSYFKENEDKVKALEIDGGNGCVAPAPESAQDGSYYLSRPLFVYPSASALQNETVDEFLRFYLDNINAVAEQVGFIPMTDEQLAKSQQQLDSLTSGGTGGTTTG
jgi:phosphate transport system substrate-binding protein